MSNPGRSAPTGADALSRFRSGRTKPIPRRRSRAANQIQDYSGKQPGDPVRAAEAIIATVEAENSPLNLPLGNFAYDAMRAEIEAVRKEAEAVEATARGRSTSRRALDRRHRRGRRRTGRCSPSTMSA